PASAPPPGATTVVAAARTPGTAGRAGRGAAAPARAIPRRPGTPPGDGRLRRASARRPRRPRPGRCDPPLVRRSTRSWPPFFRRGQRRPQQLIGPRQQALDRAHRPARLRRDLLARLVALVLHLQ